MAPQMGIESQPAPYQGFLAGTGLGYSSMDRLRRQPAILDPLRVNKTMTVFPYGSSLYPQQNTPLNWSRAFHGSRIVSESAKGACANRPLSPHLAIKKPQFSATYSISHRIFGASVASLILLSPILVKFSLVFDV